jgi:hypothetical protein
VAPMVISSMIPSLMEILILTVGEMLSILPSSKVSGVGISLLNQYICPKGRKYLVLIVYKAPCLGGAKASCERKSAL